MRVLFSLLFPMLSLCGWTTFAQPSAEELSGRADAVQRAKDRAFQEDLRASLAAREREFQAAGGRSELSAAYVQNMSRKLGIQINRTYIQAPRVSKNRWDYDSRTGKPSVVVTDAGIFCRGGGIAMNCYYNNGQYFASYEVD